MSRNYGQYCGLARALDVVGERWSLLIVRQLLIAPARYRELQGALPGVATNLLADRLRSLEAAGVIERRLADDSAVVYTLTEWGAALREPIEGLVRWSTPLMVRGPEGDPFRPDGYLVALPALLGVRAHQDRLCAVGIATEDRLVQVRSTGHNFEVGWHDGRELDAVLRADAQIVLGMAAGMLPVSDMLDFLEIEGDKTAVLAIFGTPINQGL